jgi:hypothetical protein
MALTPIFPNSLSDFRIQTGAPVTTNIAGKAFVAEVDYAADEYIAQDPAVFGSRGCGPGSASRRRTIH